MIEKAAFGELSPSTEAYRKFREIYPEAAKILEDQNYMGWGITKQIASLKWDTFLTGYQSSCQKVNE